MILLYITVHTREKINSILLHAEILALLIKKNMVYYEKVLNETYILMPYLGLIEIFDILSLKHNHVH